MKRVISESYNPRANTDLLLQAMEDGLIGAEDVAVELAKYMSDDDVGEVIKNLGLLEDDDVFSATDVTEYEVFYIDKSSDSEMSAYVEADDPEEAVRKVKRQKGRDFVRLIRVEAC